VAVGERWEASEGGLECGGNAYPVYSMVQNPCQDVVAQRDLTPQGRATHAMVGWRAAQGGPAAALHVGSIGWQHGKAEAVSEAGVELLPVELESSGERESIQPGGGGAAPHCPALVRSHARARWPSRADVTSL
jgi:hypothetical protein